MEKKKKKKKKGMVMTTPWRTGIVSQPVLECSRARTLWVRCDTAVDCRRSSCVRLGAVMTLCCSTDALVLVLIWMGRSRGAAMHPSL